MMYYSESNRPADISFHSYKEDLDCKECYSFFKPITSGLAAQSVNRDMILFDFPGANVVGHKLDKDLLENSTIHYDLIVIVEAQIKD